MIVITGASGHTGRALAEHLLDAGLPVRLVVRQAEKVQDLVARGAELALGEIEDVPFLTQAFTGAAAVYALIPPKWDVVDWRPWQRTIGEGLAMALSGAKVPKVAVLSSQGAHLAEGTGPVAGLYDFEQLLQGLPGLDVLTLRPAYFMENLYAQLPLVQAMGNLGSAIKGDLPFPMIHTRDIAAAAAQRVAALDWQGFEVQDLGGPREVSMNEVAALLGQALGRPELGYLTFGYADAAQGMRQAGMPATIAEGYVELSRSINEGRLYSDYQRNAANSTPTTIESFVATELALAARQ